MTDDCRSRHPQHDQVVCSRPLGHDGQHGYGYPGIFWEMIPPPEFHADDWFYITGRGQAATLSGEQLQGVNLRQLLKRQVKIDGTLYRVREIDQSYRGVALIVSRVQ